MQRPSVRQPVEPQKVYRRRMKPAEELLSSGRPPEGEGQVVGGELAPIVEEEVVESPSVVGQVAKSHSSEACSVVPLTAVSEQPEVFLSPPQTAIFLRRRRSPSLCFFRIFSLP